VNIAEDTSLYLANHLLFDGTSFFMSVYGDADLQGEIYRIPAAGGTPVYVGPGYGVAVDDRCVYMGNTIDGISSVVKTYVIPTKASAPK
jgi:hypothetical protein